MIAYKIIIHLNPKHKQPDGLWYFVGYKGEITFCQKGIVRLCSLGYHDIFDVLKQNCIISATIQHPTDKIFKL